MKNQNGILVFLIYTKISIVSLSLKKRRRNMSRSKQLVVLLTFKINLKQKIIFN